MVVSNLFFANNNISSFLLSPIFENNEGGSEIIENARSNDRISFDSPTLTPIANAQVNDELGTSNNGYIIMQNNTLLASAEPLTIDTSHERFGIESYEVKKGDTPSLIAASFGVTTNTLLWANDLKSTDVIKPGDKLVILPVTGIKYQVKKNDIVDTIAKKYKAESEKIIAFNDLPADGRINEGQELIIPDGEIAPPPAPPKPIKTTQPINVASKGPRPANIASAGEGFYIFPTTGRNYGRIHSNNGVDIANKCGTPIYASSDGTVNTAKSGWNGGYGTYIKITHGSNRTETLYGHLSVLDVAPGQGVSKGQFIGYMGTTGRSTGCHLHFEVHGARNPLAR